MIIAGKLVLLALFVFAVYLPLRGWHSWQGGWRYLALLPLSLLVGLVVYVGENMFSDGVEKTLSPEFMVLVVIGSLLFSAVLGLLYNHGHADES